MKKIKWMILVVLVAVLAFGCEKQKEEKEQPKKTQSADVSKQKEEARPEKKEKAEEPKAPEAEVQTPRNLLVYFPNANADGFVTEEMEISSFDADAILGCLAEKNVIPPDVQANACHVKLGEGTKMLDLDLNGKFHDYVRSQGTTGEYMTIGSVVNTFMIAYGCTGVQITIDGQALETGHGEYTGYLSMF